MNAHPQPATRMPVVFAGHGSPMNAIEDNRFSRGFAQLGAELPRPKAVLAVSAHWYVNGTYLTGNAQPETIHDFGGFPAALFAVQYPAPGHVDLAKQVCALLGQPPAQLNDEWGLDHGTWSVLTWMYPAADVPVIQLSIDRRLDARAHHELARSLGALRDEGVLIVASGNVVHNLRDAMARAHASDPSTPPWAARFDAAIADALGARDTARLLSIATDTDDGRLAHPTLDHYLPLVYAYAASEPGDRVRFASEAFDIGSVSMRSVIFG